MFDAIMNLLSQRRSNPNYLRIFMQRFFVLTSVLLFAFCSVANAQTRTYTVEDLLKVRRVADPQVSPTGSQVAFTIGDVNYEANRVVNQIYVVSLEGGTPKQLTNGQS